MANDKRTYMVTQDGTEPRLIDAKNELAVYRHLSPEFTISIPTKDQLIALLRAGAPIEESASAE